MSTVRFDAGALIVRVDARARRTSLRLDHRTGRVRLTMPPRVSRRRALAWAETQADWIAAALARLPAARPIAPGMAVPLEGVDHVLDWRADRPRAIRAEAGRIVAGGPEEGLPRRLAAWLKARARLVLEAETRALAGRAGLPVPSVSIGDPASRWGSCSSAGRIRYSWRLILAPPHVRAAIVAHEVAHLRHMDHGPAFHAFAADLLGADPRPAYGWLKREGAALQRFGR